MPRTYPIIFENAQVGIGHDTSFELEVFFGSSIYKSLELLRFWVDCVAANTLATNFFFGCYARVLEATVTHGGNDASVTATVNKQDEGDSNASFTVYTNKIVASTGGATSRSLGGGFYLFEGKDWMFDRPPIIIGGRGQSIVCGILPGQNVAETGFCYLSGGILVQEKG